MFNKPEQEHITDEDVILTLPHTRKEVFFDFLKHRKMNLFALSCFTFMFFIPLAVDLFYFNFLEAVAIANEMDDYLFSLVFYSMLIMLPCMLVGFMGLSGAFHVAKKMVWQEGTMLATDFFQGIKENWKNALINGVIFGIALFGLIMGSSYLIIFAPVAPVWSGIGIGALVLVFIALGIVLSMFFTQDVYYSNPYLVTLKNSFLFMGIINWKLLVLFVLSTGVVVGLCCINMITLGIGLFLFAVLNSVVIVLYTLISHSAFDKYINKEHHPEMVNKGLYKAADGDTYDKEA